ncbi:MAG: nucleotidyltransferase family protein [Thermoplasmataceae archaeon]
MQDTFSKEVKVFYPKYKKKELVECLQKKFLEITGKIKIVDARLFGSYAKGTNTAFSDIDIFVVVDGYDKESAYSICWDIIEIPEIELHLYVREELDIMRKNGNSFLKEIERDSIILLRSTP